MRDKSLNTSAVQSKSFISKYEKVIVLLALIIPIVFIAYRYFTAPPAGFCVAQNRVLADVEYFKFVTDSDAYSKDQKIVDGKPSVLNCCGVHRIEGDFLSKVFHSDEGVDVDWYYERTNEVVKRDGHKYYQVLHTLDSCGTTLLNTSGFAQKELIVIN